MARIAGVDLPRNKHANIALTYIYGIGDSRAARILDEAKVGKYLTHPEWVYAGNPNMASGIIFPQDVRNCIVCHDKGTSGTWKSDPSRLACTACHDSNSAIAHTNLMTHNPNPSDPYDPKRVETCTVCHGAGADFAVEKVHNISTPYKPPYPREPESK